MRILQPALQFLTTHNPFDGDVGRALYVSPAGVTDASQIVYRNLRLLSVGPASVCDQFPAIGDGPLGLDAHAALAKTPAPLAWNLPSEYLSSEFAVNVRPHKSGLELDAISGGQIMQTDAGEPALNVLGFVQVLQLTKLDGGGLRVWFRFYATAEGPQPDTFEIRDTGDPETVTTVSVAAKSDHDYRVELAGLADDTDYTFAIVGLVATDETNLITFEVTGDDAGPDVNLTLTAEVW